MRIFDNEFCKEVKGMIGDYRGFSSLVCLAWERFW